MSSMTKQEAIEILTEMRDWNDYINQSDALQMAIDELEKKPAASCEDAISRQAAIRLAEQGQIQGFEWQFKQLVDLPSVSTEKTGRWIEEDMFDGDVAYRCSECNELFWIESGTPKDNEYNFCPKCGAMLIEPQEK